MNEWASKFMSVMPSNNTKADFSKFIKEVKAETKEHLSFQKDFDEDTETRPSYEQISFELILDEANKNILVLKSLEYILQERVQAYQQFFSTLSKAKASFDIFQHCEGSLRQSLDSFYLFVEQELQQARQEIGLSEVRRSLSEMKVEAQKKLNDYMKEISNAEKDVTSCEKKLFKSKENLEKYLEFKNRNDTDSSATPIKQNTKDFIKSNMNSFTNISSNSLSNQSMEDVIMKYEKEIKDDIKSLQLAIMVRDQILQASRKAYQNLDYDCKTLIANILSKIITHEKDLNFSKNLIYDKFESTISKMNIQDDINDFIQMNKSPDNALILQSEAINILNDININNNKKNDDNINDNVKLKQTLQFDSQRESTPRRNMYPSIFRSSNSSPDGLSLSNQLLSAFGSAGSIFSSNSSTITENNKNPSILPYSFSMYSNNSNNMLNYNNQMNQVLSNLTNEFELYLNGIFHCKKGLDFNSRVSSPIDKRLERKISIPSGTYKLDTFIDKESEKDINNRIFIPNNTLEDIEVDMIDVDINNSRENGTDVALVLKHCQEVSIKLLNDNSNPHESRRHLNFPIEEAVSWLAYGTESQQGRDIFITELNKFRSKKVDVGEGFVALGAVLWAVLEHCYRANDIHCAKVVMMLSQTFYRQKPKDSPTNSPVKDQLPENSSTHIDSMIQSIVKDDDEDDESSRVVGRREYLKDLLLSHQIWQEGQFWELVLRDCAYEQLQTVPYDTAWYDLDRDRREEIVQRVHNIIFSQVMAITHSMMEFKCKKTTIREFVYRMCVIHQLSEAQRQSLLLHSLNK